MKFICIGRNYADHIKELGNERPEKPVIFLKPDTSALKHNAPFYYPDFSSDIHHEVEVILRISKEGKSIDVNFANKYYDQVGLGVDFTARDIQSYAKEKGLPWDLAKGFNGSAVISDFLPKSQFDLDNLNFRLLKNGQEVQTANTSLMIHKMDEIISYVSNFITLKTGDIIFTGTPKGVGPVTIGDRLEGFIEEQKMFDFEVK
jgi:2-keto-4-pentenoate hydratase/2-oxohepta-3-ene-1,7-dioic acid hydratase in catechol pathway